MLHISPILKHLTTLDYLLLLLLNYIKLFFFMMPKNILDYFIFFVETACHSFIQSCWLPDNEGFFILFFFQNICSISQFDVFN